MKSSQVAMLVIGIAVLIVILVFLGDIELFDETADKKKPVPGSVTYVGLDQEEKPKERKSLDLKSITVDEEDPEQLKKLGEKALVPLEYKTDAQGNFILDANGNKIPTKFVSITKDIAGGYLPDGKRGIQLDYVKGEDKPSDTVGTLVEWRCYEFNDNDKTIIKGLTAAPPSPEVTSGTAEGFYYYRATGEDQPQVVSGMDQESAEKTVCISSPDRIWTGGDNAKYPKCGGCKCCVKKPLDTCTPDNGQWSSTDEFGRSKLTSPCCQGEDGYSLPKNYKKCGDPTLNDRLPIDKCIIDCCGILSKDKTKYDTSWYPMSRCACSLWCYHQAEPHFARYGTATGYIYRRPGVQSTFYYGQ